MNPSSLTHRRAHPIAATSTTGRSARASERSTRRTAPARRTPRRRVRGLLAADTRPSYQMGGGAPPGRSRGCAGGDDVRAPPGASGVAFADLLLVLLVLAVLALLAGHEEPGARVADLGLARLDGWVLVEGLGRVLGLLRGTAAATLGPLLLLPHRSPPGSSSGS